MAIITLTTDLKYKDFYVAKLKGRILSFLPSVNIVDITHEIPHFDIAHAAFVLKNSYAYFPKGTIHLVGVDTLSEANNKYLAIQYDGYYFVGADNGLFSIMLGKSPEKKMVEIGLSPDMSMLHFPLADTLVEAACKLAQGVDIEQLGTVVSTVQERTLFQPLERENQLQGRIIYVDAYQNAISNITREKFEEVQRGRKFRLSFRRDYIDKLSWHYNEVEEGEKLCLFGSSGHLEIAVNKAKAVSLLGLNIGEPIIIDFY